MVGFTIEKDRDESSGNFERAAFTSRYFTSRKNWCEWNVRGVAFGADSGTVALALATGEVTMPIPESVKVTFKGEMMSHMDFRDVVHATQAQMLDKFDGENVFQGRVIEVHIGTLIADEAFTFTDWTADGIGLNELVVDTPTSNI